MDKSIKKIIRYILLKDKRLFLQDIIDECDKMNETKLIGTFFKPRQKAIARYATEAESLQEKVLHRLVSKAAHTEWGKEHHYSAIKNYQDFQREVPVQTYEEIKGYVDRMRHGEKNVLWPGQVVWYAKSSGTTNDKSKFIPVSKEGL